MAVYGLGFRPWPSAGKTGTLSDDDDDDDDNDDDGGSPIALRKSAECKSFA